VLARQHLSDILRPLGTVALLGLMALPACGPDPVDPQPAEPLVDDPDPPHALWSKVEEFRRDLAAERSVSDGGGSAYIEWPGGEMPVIRAGRAQAFDLRFRAGPHGIAVGGQIHFMPEPFWGWSVPQTTRPDRGGFTRVTTDAEGVELEAFSVGTAVAGYLVIEVGGRALQGDEQVRIEYGVEGRGALVDRHAERGAHLWFYVDGDGDGIRGLMTDSPTVDVLAGPAARVVATTPSIVRPGEPFFLNLALLDMHGNDGVEFEGTVHIQNRPPSWNVPDEVHLTLEDGGHKRIEILAESSGVVRLAVEVQVGETLLRSEAGPTWIDAHAERVFWGDLHGHSNFSDGTGEPNDWFDYARHTAALDFVCLTDHDHFGVRFIDQSPDLWEQLCAVARDHHVTGQFVTLSGYEWTSWIHGHRHVVFFDDSAEMFSSVDERYQTPRQLWLALEGRNVLTFAHHSAGDPIPTNWTFRPDPILEPVTEVMSVHGSSEAADSPRLVRNPRPGNYVRDVLDRGVALGFIGSGDSHDGHPGLSHLSPVYGWRPGRTAKDVERMGTGGLAAVMGEKLTRGGLLAALRARNCYATSGPRMILQATLEGHPMGSSVPAQDVGPGASIDVLILGTVGLTRLDLVRSGTVSSMSLQGERRFMGSLPLEDLQPGEYVYLRVLQEDGSLAWTSPFFVE
jgi:hypothetical protein